MNTVQYPTLAKSAAPASVALPVMEDFYTVQGEGAYTGHAAYFIRLAGCDVGCVWCDVKDSWHMDRWPRLEIVELVQRASAHPAQKAVITGGEPFMHNLDGLTGALKAAGFSTHVETSGAWPYSGNFDWVTLSPKKFKKPLPEFFDLTHELKVVIYHKSDFKWAEEYAQQMPESCRLFLQPEWDKREQMMPLIAEYVKANPKWQISLQTHKYLKIP